MPTTTFLRLLDADDKATALLAAVQGHAPQRVFHTDPASFAQVPGSPFAYWVSENLRRIFTEEAPFESEGRKALGGLKTLSDERFIRAWWEVPASRIGEKGWAPLAKGGSFSPFYGELPLVVQWSHEGNDISWYGYQRRPREGFGGASRGIEAYFRPGITWPRRTNGLSFRILPAGAIFGDKGPAAFIEDDNQNKIACTISIMNSLAFASLVRIQLARVELAQSFEVGIIQITPVPDLNNPDGERLGELALACVHLKRNLDTANEISHVFHLPALLQVSGETLAARAAAWAEKVADSEAQLAANQREIDEIAFRLYGIEGSTVVSSQVPGGSEGVEHDEDDDSETLPPDNRLLTTAFISYLVGLPFGRWDIRYATGERTAPELPDPFAPLPVYSPGMLQPVVSSQVPVVSSQWSVGSEDKGKLGTDHWPLTILVDDPGHAEDIEGRVREVIRVVGGGQWAVGNQDNVSNTELPPDHWQLTTDRIEQEACEILGVTSLREYLRRPAGFFADHLSRYSKSRRQAPIYWPLAVGSTYTIWLYYHHLTDQTLYRCVNDFIDPKLNIVNDQWSVSSSKSGRTAREEKELEYLRDLIRELTELRAEILRVAVFWKPNLNDGVQISAAPLWRLFQHKPWQKKLKATWESLERGDYDWAQLAYSLWPARVREKCKTDKSLSIAHGLEEMYVEVTPTKAKRGKKKPVATEDEGMFGGE